jgi:glycosyltransferase involved in cell wall biosynthesis
MRILRIIGGLDAAAGGPSQSAVNAAIAASRAGVDTTLAFAAPIGAPPPPATARLEDEGVKLHRFALARLLGTRGARWGISPALARWLVAHGKAFDIIHCHGAWQLATLVALYGGGAAKRVLTPHESLTGYDIAQTRTPLMGPLKRHLKPRILNNFDSVIFASALEAADSVTAGMAAKSTVLAHPVFDERAAPPPATRPARKGFQLGYLGRLHPKKNIPLLIEALAALPEDICLTVAGSGPAGFDEAYRRLATANNVAGRITWLGFIDAAAKEEFFAAIDLLVMPSAYECFGMAAAEAMIRGIAVCVSPQTGIAEIVARHGGGRVVAPAAAALAAAIAALAEDPAALVATAHRAAGAARAAYGFEPHGAALAGHYARLLGQR